MEDTKVAEFFDSGARNVNPDVTKAGGQSIMLSYRSQSTASLDSIRESDATPVDPPVDASEVHATRQWNPEDTETLPKFNRPITPRSTLDSKPIVLRKFNQSGHELPPNNSGPRPSSNKSSPYTTPTGPVNYAAGVGDYSIPATAYVTPPPGTMGGDHYPPKRSIAKNHSSTSLNDELWLIAIF